YTHVPHQIYLSVSSCGHFFLFPCAIVKFPHILPPIARAPMHQHKLKRPSHRAWKQVLAKFFWLLDQYEPVDREYRTAVRARCVATVPFSLNAIDFLAINESLSAWVFFLS